MKKVVLLLVIFTLLLPLSLLAANGKIAGKVKVKSTNEALANASVFLDDSKTGTYTKKDGSFIFKEVPEGEVVITVRLMGFKTTQKTVMVKADETVVVNFDVDVEAIKMGGVTVSATRAVERETPIAFTDVSQEKIANKYTTDDVPQLLEGVPGLFASTGGLGEGELKVRGFDQDKVQILINGIPVNDPESQQVYWSNWTGLSSNVKSVQVQRGAGSSLYGSGAFGGSINIETIGAGVDPDKGWTFRTSAGSYAVQDEVADGKGNMVDFTPWNYNFMLRYQSGIMYDGKLNYSIMAERKVGDSYNIGTKYDGYSFGAEVQNVWGNHKVNTSLIVAPQWHNQMRTTSDMELEDALGRNYNRNNNPEQENYYNKPQLSIRDEWKISDQSLMMTNLFVTRGDGGGKYLRNDKFDVTTGKVYNMPVNDYTDNKYFGRHAYHYAMTQGIELDGVEIFWNDTDPTVIDSVYFNGELIDYGYDLINRDYNHSWTNDSMNNHKQFGFNTYFEHKVNPMLKLVVGGEARYWKALHRAMSVDFRYNGGCV
jgi:outer membrane receptor protein involved in Fe transport